IDCVDIIGGHDVKSNSRLYMASIQINKTHECGGALIKPQWVLTTAHCRILKTTMKLWMSDLAQWWHLAETEVIVGSHSLSKQENKQTIKLKKTFPHPSFTWDSFGYDIMLLPLKNKANLNKFVSTLKLPKSTKSIKPGTKCSVAGWGEDGTKSYPDTLKEANVTVLKMEICKKIYSLNLTNDMICALGQDSKQDVRKGDSGGPLICKKKWLRQNVYSGIVSFGSRSGDNITPSVYTQLSNNYLSWINKVIHTEHY
ncbi:granzyme K-like, partial [Stegostoma tigrinum]|uniref:granzyme K-like n=1 Tax=Stegostoma tigrinum TaxID=3053191 RepID=UPI0028704CD0